ncbi:MAG: hypothetical protein QOJ74_2254 [Ilumatobacteraceae bacterium]|jgi:hypothetical protein|nr:hypothetical protein [Ilumatobacteraceae bacterium]
MTAVADIAVPRKTRRWVRAMLVLVCALIAAMWVYAFGFASKTGVYYVTDKGWRTSAEQICVEATQRRLALADTSQGYIAKPTHEQMIQRADIVDKATDTLDHMINDIEALPLATSDNRERVTVFVKYYREIISDRRAYTARLRAFQLTSYRETMVLGSPVTNTVTDFTTGNAIPHCMPPGELGGDT